MAMLVALGLSSQSNEAMACGGFFSQRAGRKPSLSYEQVVIVYDAKTSTEHFIREVTFNEGSATFGFVVPTPSRPEVAQVDDAPFQELRATFPFAPARPMVGHGAGSGTGQGFGSGAGSVSVLETVKVGSFTAFVLAADDEKALAKWLVDNGLASTPESDEWLAHYVRMRFFYVAMRYDPPKAATQVPTASAMPVTSEGQRAMPVARATGRRPGSASRTRWRRRAPRGCSEIADVLPSELERQHRGLVGLDGDAARLGGAAARLACDAVFASGQ